MQKVRREAGGCTADCSADSSLRFGMTESLWGGVGCAVSSEKRKAKNEKPKRKIQRFGFLEEHGEIKNLAF